MSVTSGYEPIATVTEEERVQLVARAREDYGADEIEVDDDAEVSVTPNGKWVAAWLWLQDEEPVAKAVTP